MSSSRRPVLSRSKITVKSRSDPCYPTGSPPDYNNCWAFSTGSGSDQNEFIQDVNNGPDGRPFPARPARQLQAQWGLAPSRARSGRSASERNAMCNSGGGGTRISAGDLRPILVLWIWRYEAP